MITPVSNDDERHIFISHASQQLDYALRVADFLKQHGFSVWIDRKGIDYGDNWWDVIEKAITDQGLSVEEYSTMKPATSSDSASGSRFRDEIFVTR